MRPRQGGFTLVELLLAMAIASLVLTAAVGSLGLLAEADSRVSQRMGQRAEIRRALGLLGRDVAFASSASISGRRLLLVRADGAAVVWEFGAGSSELHRITGASASTAQAAADSQVAAGGPSPRFGRRGHLLDSDYRPSAVLQGILGGSWQPVQPLQGGSVVGVRASIDHAGETGTVRSEAVAVMLPKVATGQ